MARSYVARQIVKLGGQPVLREGFTTDNGNVILDVHNEYAAAFGGLVEPINLDNFSLPFWMLDFTEMVAALVSRDAHYDAEVEILSDAVVQAKKR